jgi:photosystem II stability/assembly factor-like uncharacterized protein
VLHPTAVAFLSATRGVIAGQMVTNPTKIDGLSAIELTSDGGATWRIVHRLSGPVASLSAVDPGNVWALVADGYKTGAPSHLLASSDGGATWRRAGGPVPGVVGVTFVSRHVGYALRVKTAARPDAAPWTLLRTADGGRSWRAVARACPAGTTAAAIVFVDSANGWLLRSGEPSAGQQLRELLETRNGGVSWRRVAGTLSPSKLSASSSDGLGSGGYPGSLFFLADGHGWIGLNYAASIIATEDGGRRWHPAGRRLSDYGAGPMWFLNAADGFAIAGSGVHFSLMRTRNGGRSWGAVHRWSLGG